MSKGQYDSRDIMEEMIEHESDAIRDIIIEICEKSGTWDAEFQILSTAARMVHKAREERDNLLKNARIFDA